ncbi:MAG: rhodanese-like domain-containing protein [Deinococcota bacterium]
MSEHTTPEVDVQETQRRIESGALLVDVREQDEYDTVRIPNTVLIPLSELQERYSELPKDRDLVIHCRSGKRSAKATDFLNQHGYNATNVAGGILAWEQQELPVIHGEGNEDA